MGMENLLYIMKLVSDRKMLAEFQKKYRDGTLRNVELKDKLAKDISAFLEPIQTRMKELENNYGDVEEILKNGAREARENASATLEEAYREMNFYSSLTRQVKSKIKV